MDRNNSQGADESYEFRTTEYLIRGPDTEAAKQSATHRYSRGTESHPGQQRGPTWVDSAGYNDINPCCERVDVPGRAILH